MWRLVLFLREMNAVCIHCGKRKSGALTLCGVCGRAPDSSEEMAQAVLLSDHNLLGEDLGTLAARIASGEGVTFRTEDVERIARNIDVTRKGRPWKSDWILVLVGVLFFLAFVMAVLIRSTQR